MVSRKKRVSDSGGIENGLDTVSLPHLRMIRVFHITAKNTHSFKSLNVSLTLSFCHVLFSR